MKNYLYKELSKQCDPNDFMGQVKRTVNGKPVSEDQIKMIVESIEAGLKLEKEDILFDLGCGNGALSVLLFDKIKKYVGVDFSEYLIEIAQTHFEKQNFSFSYAEASEYLRNEKVNDQFTKGLCYGTFSYFEKKNVHEILANIRKKYVNLRTFYIGNIPDKDRASSFFYKDIDYSRLIEDDQSSIGVWWSKEEFKLLAANTGWQIEFYEMPQNFYSAHYRFDVILSAK